MCKETGALKNVEKQVTFAQVKSHNTPHSAWTIVHDQVLDITEFAKRHPGGDIILLSAGRDATVLFHTYHPRGVPKSLLDKLQVGIIADKPVSYYDWNSSFYSTLCQRVVERLHSINRPLRGNRDIQIKAFFILASFWFSLYKMYTVSEFHEAIGWSIVMGVFAHFVGTCIQHDGNHGAFSKVPLVNTVAGWTMDMIGASAFTWQFQHMLGHHPYTNLLDVHEEELKSQSIDTPLSEKDQESDPDVFSSFPLMRMHPVHEPQWYHRFQHLYAPVLFAFMTLAKVFQQDIQVAWSHRLYHIDAECRYGSMWNVLRFWGMKAVSMVYMIGLPCYFHGIRGGLILFAVGHLACGEVLATMFIVNHVIEGVSFANKDNSKGKEASSKAMTAQGVTPMVETLKTVQNTEKIPLNDWAAVQCQTSVNWSPGSWFWNHFSGGLNHQIEHHLFPSICHTNYVYIQDVVENTCREFGVPYQSEPNLFVAYGKMLGHLKTMGRTKGL
mmetsp:Transcript_3406/g.6427  ORF Transcript_3406/g.6427 Transcript_3406/m.6427 type:complete len:497 (-) Transcript_3406:1036-2526(-)